MEFCGDGRTKKLRTICHGRTLAMNPQKSVCILQEVNKRKRTLQACLILVPGYYLLLKFFCFPCLSQKTSTSFLSAMAIHDCPVTSCSCIQMEVPQISLTFCADFHSSVGRYMDTLLSVHPSSWILWGSLSWPSDTFNNCVLSTWLLLLVSVCRTLLCHKPLFNSRFQQSSSLNSQAVRSCLLFSMAT